MLVAAFYADHDGHAESLDLLVRFRKQEACCGAYSLAEVYAVMTGRSGRERMSGEEALLFLSEIRGRLTVITLSGAEYAKAIHDAAAVGVIGGGIYDALLGHCALKAKAESLYTWNVKQFERLGPVIGRRVKTP